MNANSRKNTLNQSSNLQNKKTSRNAINKRREDIIFRVSIFAAIIGPLAIAISIYAIIDARSLAKETGALRKSSVELGFGDQRTQSLNTQVAVLIPKECRATPVLLEIPFTLFNFGEKASSNVSLTTGYLLSEGQSVALSEGINDAFSLSGPPVAGNFVRSTADDETYRYVTYKIDVLPPKSSVTFSEPVAAPLPVSIDINELRQDLTGSISIKYAYKIPIIISSNEGDDLSTGSLTLMTFRGSSLEEAEEEMKNYAKKKLDDYKEDQSWMDIHSFFAPPTVELFVIEPEKTMCESANGSFVFSGKVNRLIMRSD